MKLNIGFTQYMESELVEKAGTIVHNLTGNAKFPLPIPTPASINTLITNLSTAMTLSGVTRTTAVAAARDTLETELSKLGINLMGTPNVTEADLATTGFDLPKTPVRSGAVPPAPQNVRLKHGTQSCEIVPLCDPVTEGGVRVYEAEWTLDPNSGIWNAGGSFPSTRAMLLKALPRAKDVWVRLRVQGTNGPSAWSDPATILVS